MRNTSRIKFSHQICLGLLLQLASISALPVTDLNHIDDLNSTTLTGSNHDSLPQPSTFDRPVQPTGNNGAANNAAPPPDNWQRPDKVMTLAPIDDVSRMLLSNLLSPSLPMQPYYGSILPVPLVDTRWLYNGNVKIKPSNQDANIDQNFGIERGDVEIRSSATPTASFPIIFSQSYGSHTSAKPKQSGFAAAVGEENSDAVKQTTKAPTGPENHKDNRALTGNQRHKPRRHRVDVEKLEEMKMEWTGGRGHSRTITSASADLMLYTPEDTKRHHETNTTFSFRPTVPTATVEKVSNNSHGFENNETLSRSGGPKDDIETLQSTVNVGDIPEVAGAGGKSSERKLTPGRLMASYKSADEGPNGDSEVIAGDTPNVEDIGTVKEDSVYPVVQATTPADITYAFTSSGKQEAISRPMSGGQPLKSTSEPLQLLPDDTQRPPAHEITLLSPSPDDLSIPVREENGNEIVEPDMDSAAASSEDDRNNIINKGDVTTADDHVTVGSVESSSTEKSEIEPSVDMADVAEQTDDAPPMEMIYRTVTPPPVRYMAAGQDLLRSVPTGDDVVSTPVPATATENNGLLKAVDGGTNEDAEDVTRNSIDHDDVTEERQNASQEPSPEGSIVNSQPARHEKTVTKYHGHSSADDKGPTDEHSNEKTFAMDSRKPDVKNEQLASHEQKSDADLQQASSLASFSPDTANAENADKIAHVQKKSFVVPYAGKETYPAENTTSTKPMNDGDYNNDMNRSDDQTTKPIPADSIHVNSDVKSDTKKLTESIDNVTKTNTDQQTLVASNRINAGSLEETTSSISSKGNPETATEFAVDDSFRQARPTMAADGTALVDTGNSSGNTMQSISVDDLKRKSEKIVEATTAAEEQYMLALDHTSSDYVAASTPSPYSDHVTDYRETTIENTVDQSTSTYSTLSTGNTLHDVNALSHDDVVTNTVSNTSVLPTVNRTTNESTQSSLLPPLSTDKMSGNVSVPAAPLDSNAANVRDDAAARLLESVAVSRVHHERVAKHQSPVDSLIVGFDRHVEYSSKATEQQGNQLSASTTTVAAGLQQMTEENDNGRMLPSSKIQNPQQNQSKNEALVTVAANDTNSGEDTRSIRSRLLQTTAADLPLTATFFDEASKEVAGGGSGTTQTTTVLPNEFETTSCSTPNYNDAVTSSDVLPDVDVTSSPTHTDHLQNIIGSNSVMTADDRLQNETNRAQNKETNGDRFADVAGKVAVELTDDRHHNPMQHHHHQQPQHHPQQQQKKFPIKPEFPDMSNQDSQHHMLRHGLTSDDKSVVDYGLTSSDATVNHSSAAAGYTNDLTAASISPTTSNDNTTGSITVDIETKIGGPGQFTTERYNVEAVQMMDLAHNDMTNLSTSTTFSNGNNVETEPNVDQSSFNSIVNALVTLLVDGASSSSTPETSTPTAVTSEIGSAPEEHHRNNVTPPQATLNNDLDLPYSNQQSSVTSTWSTTPDSSNYSDPLQLEVVELTGQKAPINLEMIPALSAKVSDSASEQTLPPSPLSFIQSSTQSTDTVEFLTGTSLLNDSAQTTSTSSTVELNGDERNPIDDHLNSSWAQVDTEAQLTTRGSSIPSAEASLSGDSALSGISTPTSALTRPWLIGLVATAGVCVFVFVAVLSFLAVVSCRCLSAASSTH